MMRKKQKEFFWGGALTVGSAALGIKQAGDAEKQNEELAEQSRRDNAKTRKALDRLANSGVSPEVKEQAASLFSDQRIFAAPGGFVKNVLGFGKDLWNHSGGGVKKAVKMGAGFAGVGYLGNRIATSIKDHDEGRDDKNASFLKKAALGTAAVGGGILAARHGLLGGGAQNFMNQGFGKRVLDTGKNIFKENISPIHKNDKGKYRLGLGGVMNTAFLAAPTISYLVQRNNKPGQDMANSSMESQGQPEEENQQQRQYAITPGSIMGYVKKGWNYTKNTYNHVKTNPAQALTGGFSKAANFIGMMGGKGGTHAVQEGFKKLGEIGAKSGNKYTQKLAEWATKDGNQWKANLLAGGATIAAGTTAMGIGDKIVSKPMKALDRDAYKMEEENETMI